MANFSVSEWQSLLQPYLAAPAELRLIQALEVYLTVLLRWNTRMNLTAVRDPISIVQRHFGEGLFAARHVPRGTPTLLDHGSGAGFPGLPIALARPEIAVTLTESQTKKAMFLQEAVRALGVTANVHPARTETLPGSLLFDCVAMRAVDDAAKAYPAALARVGPAGCLLVLEGAAAAPCELVPTDQIAIPGSVGYLRLYRPGGAIANVPRGTC